MSSVEKPFEERVRRAVRAIAVGDVSTYGEIAAEAGNPGAARAVGRVLAGGDGGLPWWRVVAANGRLVPGNETEHARLLGGEGVQLRNGKVRMGS